MAGKYKSGGFWSNAFIFSGIAGLVVSSGTFIKSCQYSGYEPRYTDTKSEEIDLQTKMSQIQAQYGRLFNNASREIKNRIQENSYVPSDCENVNLSTQGLKQGDIAEQANCLNELGLNSSQKTIVDLTIFVQNQREFQDYRAFVANSQNAVKGAKDKALGVAAEGVSWFGIGLLGVSVASLAGGLLGKSR